MSAPRRKLASAVAGLVARRVGETTRCEPCVFSDRARAMHALARGVIARDRVEKSPFDRDAQQRRDVSAFKRFPFPKSHGAEGLPDQYLRKIKKIVPMSEVIDNYIPGSGKHTSYPPADPTVWYGELPPAGAKRHLKGMTAETIEEMENLPLDWSELDGLSGDEDDDDDEKKRRRERHARDVGAGDFPTLKELQDAETEESKRRMLRRILEMKKQKEDKLKRVSVRDEEGRSGATGRRKTATARVTIKPGTGVFFVNHKPLDEYILDINERGWALSPFVLTKTIGLFDAVASVRGGGLSGQAQAIRHGVARALQLYEPSFRPALKRAGYLTRDPRMVERKKPGRKKARKAFQWVKR